MSSEGMRPQLLQMTSAGMQMTDAMGNVMTPSNDNQQTPQMLDTSQPPPIRPPTSTPLLPPPNPQLQMMPPGFPMSNVTRMFCFTKIYKTNRIRFLKKI